MTCQNTLKAARGPIWVVGRRADSSDIHIPLPQIFGPGLLSLGSWSSL
jgi:hypothetical protein